MSVGSKTSEIISKSGFSAVYLHKLHLRAQRGNEKAREDIQGLIRQNPELRFVFNSFFSARERVADAKRAVAKLKSAKREDSWARLRGNSGKSPGLPLQGGLPGLGKRS